MDQRPRLEQLHGKTVIVRDAVLVRKGEPKADGSPARIDHVRIRFSYDGMEGTGAVTGNIRHVMDTISSNGETDLIVDVDRNLSGWTNIGLKPIEPVTGTTVTRRISSMVPPEGGYVPLSSMEIVQTDEGRIDIPRTLRPDVAGQCIQYYATDLYTGDHRKSTEISRMGFDRMDDVQKETYLDLCHRFGEEEDDRRRIGLMYSISSYDELFRSGCFTNGPEDPDITDEGADALLEASNRVVSFMARNDPVGIWVTFPGGYTDAIRTGDADVLCRDCLWDIKVSRYPPTRDNILQVLVYYLMGRHSNTRDLYSDVSRVGIYNPLLGKEYIVELSSISDKTLESVERDVIGYGVRCTSA